MCPSCSLDLAVGVLLELLLLGGRHFFAHGADRVATDEPPILNEHPVGNLVRQYRDFLSDAHSLDVHWLVVNLSMEKAAVEADLVQPDVFDLVPLNEWFLDGEAALVVLGRAQGGDELLHLLLRRLHGTIHCLVGFRDLDAVWLTLALDDASGGRVGLFVRLKGAGKEQRGEGG